MEIAIDQLNKNKNISAGRTTSMKLDDDSQAMIFQLFTGGLYSDPIGTVIREITSNCFDSHKEANVDPREVPVIVRLGKDIGGQHISFIDKGVGMSPTRVHKIYGTYFASTKRGTNTQHGGFGLGGKTPLAYTDSFYITTISTKQAELEYCEDEIVDILLYKLPNETDNELIKTLEADLDYFWNRYESSKKITNKNVHYVYDIFEDEKQPAIDLMKMHGTDETTGTTVKVPVLDSDVADFNRKTLKQLYYFEDVIFEGFSDHIVTNEYEIIKGKNFLYRGNDFDYKMHASYGKVAYPLDFDTLGLDEYEHEIPIAIKFKIGELEGTGVTPSRESLKYTKKNIKIIKDKINAAIDELTEMLNKQHSNVISLQDYFDVINNNLTLNLTKDKSIYLGRVIYPSKIDYPNFKFKHLDIPEKDTLFDGLYMSHRYGRAGVKYSYKYPKSWNENFDTMDNHDNIYYSEGEFNRDVKKQGFLKWLSSTDNFFIIQKTKLNEYKLGTLIDKLGLGKIHHLRSIGYDRDNLTDGLDFEVQYFEGEKTAKNILAEFLNEFHKIVIGETSGEYHQIEITQDYLDFKKRKIQKKEVLEYGIPLKCYANQYGNKKVERIQLKELDKFRGRIFYGFQENEYELDRLSHVFDSMGYSDRLVRAYKIPKEKQGIAIVRIAKSNEKYLKMLGKKVTYVKHFDETFMYRKIDDLIKSEYIRKISYLIEENVPRALKHPRLLKHVNKDIYQSYRNIENFKSSGNIVNKMYLNLDKLDRLYGTKLAKGVDWKDSEVSGDVEKLIEVSEKSRNKLRWLDLPYDVNLDEEADRELISLMKMMIE